MDLNVIASAVDHTQLKVDATWMQIKTLCDEAVSYRTASVCIPAAYVKQAADYLSGRIPVCTVIGFPNGYSTTETKVFETKNAIANGAEEIDMVIHIGALKDKRYDDILQEIKAVKAACGNHILKVIVETCLLNEEEKIKMCELVTASGADFIKTSTGFSAGGATAADIDLFAHYVGKCVRIKAAGGVSGLMDAERFLALGAKRLGTSSLVKLLHQESAKGEY